jgi:hypothetical protein
VGNEIVLGLDSVVVRLERERPVVLTVGDEDAPLLPAAPFDPLVDRTLELAARRSIHEQAGIDVGYLEQLYTFGDRHRDPREVAGGPRYVTVGYLALTGAASEGNAASGWRDWYEFFPWEDRRAGLPPVLSSQIAPLVRDWMREGQRRLRAIAAFGLDEAPWNDEAVLERYEILYEIGAVGEAPHATHAFGRSMGLDHRRILATAMGRLRGKIKYRPVIFELLDETFTLWQLQRAVEALAGTRLHKPNFRRLVEESGIVIGTGDRIRTSGRPAETYRFRPEIIAERPDPGIAIR